MTKISNNSTSKLTFRDLEKKQLIVRIALIVFFLMSMLAIFWASNRENINFSYLMWFVVGYTAISAICSYVIFYLASTFVNRQWTPAKHFIITFIATSVIWVCDSTYYYFFLNIYNFSFSKTLQLHFLVVFLIGAAIGGFGYFWIKGRYLHFNLYENEEQNDEQISRLLKENPEQKMITLCGNSPKNSLTIFPQELLYIESTGNYVHIYCLIEEKVIHRKLRSTVSKMEDTLKQYPFIVRCHRAFIVNIQQIREISGSKILLNSIETDIPISKTYKAISKKQLNFIHRSSQI